MEENSEKMKKDDTEKKEVFDNNLKNAYEVDNVQRATRGIYCKKHDKTVRSMNKLGLSWAKLGPNWGLRLEF